MSLCSLSLLLLGPHINPYSEGIDFRRQIVLSKVHPHSVKIKIFVMAVDP